jgi:endonuclease/exonuclease/phosphatase family metal-dependent hydrolase
MGRASAIIGALALVALAATACSSDDTSSPADTAAPVATGALTVLAYNVAGLPQEISTVNPEKHIPLIATRLEPFDLVLTQEDFDWWLPELDDFDFVNYHTRLRSQSDHLPHRTERHPGPEAAGLDRASRPTLFVGDGLGIMSRYPIRDAERRAWKGCFGGLDTSDGGAGDCLAMKGFAVATMTLADTPDGPVEVDVYTLHVEAGGTAEDQRLQAADLDQLAAFIDEHSAGRAVILAGDTNLHTDDDHRDSSADGGAGARSDARLWEAFLRRTGLTDTCGVVTCDDPGAIDKLAFRSGGGTELEPLAHRFAVDDFQDESGEDLSDHPPLVVTLAWRQTR